MWRPDHPSQAMHVLANWALWLRAKRLVRRQDGNASRFSTLPRILLGSTWIAVGNNDDRATISNGRFLTFSKCQRGHWKGQREETGFGDPENTEARRLRNAVKT